MNHKPFTMYHKLARRAQSTLEFTFAMVVIALLIFGLIKVFRWVGLDYAQKAYLQQREIVIDGSGQFQTEARRQRLDAVTRKF